MFDLHAIYHEMCQEVLVRHFFSYADFNVILGRFIRHFFIFSFILGFKWQFWACSYSVLRPISQFILYTQST